VSKGVVPRRPTKLSLSQLSWKMGFLSIPRIITWCNALGAFMSVLGGKDSLQHQPNRKSKFHGRYFREERDEGH